MLELLLQLFLLGNDYLVLSDFGLESFDSFTILLNFAQESVYLLFMSLVIVLQGSSFLFKSSVFIFDSPIFFTDPFILFLDGLDLLFHLNYLQPVFLMLLY
jgi:hypothetical protein